MMTQRRDGLVAKTRHFSDGAIRGVSTGIRNAGEMDVFRAADSRTPLACLTITISMWTTLAFGRGQYGVITGLFVGHVAP